MSWPMVKIGDVCTLMTGGTPKTCVSEFYENGTVPWIVSGDLHKGEIFDCEKRITEYAVENSNARYLPKDSVLIALNGQGKTRGTVALLRIKGATCNQSVVSISPNNNEELYSDYLFYYLKSQYQSIRNITGDQDRAGLNMPLIRDISIPLPLLTEQKRIATILDKADAIRHKRHQAIQLADEFLRAVFLDMFGDPVTNPNGWEVQQLGKLIEDGPSNGLYKPASEYGSGIRILRIDGFYNGVLSLQEKLKRVILTPKEVEKYRLKERSIVINRVNSREYLGKTAFIEKLDETTVFESNMMNFSVIEDVINPYFLVQQLQTPYIKNQILKLAKDAVNQSSINQQDVKSLEIIVPKLPLQRKFEQICNRYSESLFAYKRSLYESENMFASLSQKAFSGQL